MLHQSEADGWPFQRGTARWRGDGAGVTNGSTLTSAFDYEDRLTGIGSTASYDYIGASADRFSKTVSGTTTKFLYDGGSVTEEMQGGTVTADYGASAEKLGGTVYWMLQDGQPSIRQLLNSSQSIVSAYINDSFGNSVSSSGTAGNPFKWNGGSGYYSDSENGLQKVGARYYDPSVGTWTSQDTMLVAGSPADSQAVNRYLYCGANPVGRLDPSGHGYWVAGATTWSQGTNNLDDLGLIDTGKGYLLHRYRITITHVKTVVWIMMSSNGSGWLTPMQSITRSYTVSETLTFDVSVEANPIDEIVHGFLDNH